MEISASSQSFGIASFAAGASQSSVIELDGFTLVSVMIPANWTAASLAFSISLDGVSYLPLIDAAGNEVTLNAVAGEVLPVSAVPPSSKFIVLRSGSVASPVVQASALTLEYQRAAILGTQIDWGAPMGGQALSSGRGLLGWLSAISATVSDDAASGTITTQNLNPNSGTATAGSTVSLALNGCSTLGIHILGTSTYTCPGGLSVQLSNDNATWVTVTGGAINALSSYQAGTMGSGSTGLFSTNVAGFAYARVTALNAVTGSAAVFLRASAGAADVALLPGNAVVGTVAVSAPVNSSLFANMNCAAVSGNTSAVFQYQGVSDAFQIIATAWTAGASTGLDLYLQTSYDNGTTWVDMWQVEAITATGTYFIPPTLLTGACFRFRWVNRTGAATTATITITSQRVSGVVAIQRQFFDRTAALLSGTLNATSTAYDISGAKQITCAIALGAATTPGSYQLQVSNDNVNWAAIGAAQAGTANAMVMWTNSVSARFARVICTSAGSGQTGTYLGIYAA